jgi:hypothetical protein
MSAAYTDTLATVGPDFGKIVSGSVEMMPIVMVETINSTSDSPHFHIIYT